MSARDGSTQEHAERVQRYARAVAIEADITFDDQLDAIEAAALLHDIGKLAIPDRVLHKPGPLTRAEFELVKQHPTIGADILAAALPGPLAEIVRHHHENWDGTGYPAGLAGDEIPVGARVVAIVDCYDALTSDRPYRRALPHETAVGMIEERRGTMYDPEIAGAFLRVVQRLRTGVARERMAQRRKHAAWQLEKAV
jgi:HD-GYP domain-containing protein (c-di-GMP phosphodiesterase class II)